MRIVTVVGARPNFMKAAAIVAAVREHNRQRGSIHHLLVHTGQHYDALMSDSFFADLDLPRPDIMLNVGSGSHAIQTADVLTRFEAVLLKERPDVVIVVGDVNSTVAAALATAKISFDENGTRPMLVHVEAGLRSSDRSMPEEINRVVTDHLCDLLFVTERSGCENLKSEGIDRDKVHLVGNTMIDSLLAFRQKADRSTVLERLRLQSGRQTETLPYAVLTMHRPANVDRRDQLVSILQGLNELATRLPIIFPVHPRTRQRIQTFGLDGFFTSDVDGSAASPGFNITDPLGYLDFLCLMKNAQMVITDSGGIQEETTALGIPCVTVRDNTERPVTVDVGTNIVAGTDSDRIAAAVQKQLTRVSNGHSPEMWDGRAAERIVAILWDTWCTMQPGIHDSGHAPSLAAADRG